MQTLSHAGAVSLIGGVKGMVVVRKRDLFQIRPVPIAEQVIVCSPSKCHWQDVRKLYQ